MAIQIVILKTKKILFNFISAHLQRHFHNIPLKNTKQKKKKKKSLGVTRYFMNPNFSLSWVRDPEQVTLSF